jgi:hypothetical protein
MRKFIWIFGFLFLTFSCKKEIDGISIVDSVKQTQYYDNEIFSAQNQKIYGQWELLFSYGGLAGSKIMPTSNYTMEFITFGIYGEIKDNEITGIGKIRIVRQDNIQTVIDFVPDDKYKTDYFLIQKDIVFKGKDTLIIGDYNMSDGYYDYYKRIK